MLSSELKVGDKVQVHRAGDSFMVVHVGAKTAALMYEKNGLHAWHWIESLTPYDPPPTPPTPPSGRTVEGERRLPKKGEEYWNEGYKYWETCCFAWCTDQTDSTGHNWKRWILTPLQKVERWTKPFWVNAAGQIRYEYDPTSPLIEIPLRRIGTGPVELDTDAIELEALKRLANHGLTIGTLHARIAELSKGQTP